MFILEGVQSYNYITDTLLLVFDIGIYIVFVLRKDQSHGVM